MNRTLKSVLSLFAAIAALLVLAPAGAAQPDQKPAQDDVTIMGIGEATGILQAPTWIRFRPNPLYGEHLELNFGTDIATICKDWGTDGETWNLVLDHDKKFVGWTHAYNLSVKSQRWCSDIGQSTALHAEYNPAWVHLYPKEDWAYDVVANANNLATLCWVTNGGIYWDIVLAHNTNTVGFTHSSYLVNAGSRTNCS
ncbi:hypothetical protein ACWGE0_02395 [Lentzea sp. NPDC054927]